MEELRARLHEKFRAALIEERELRKKSIRGPDYFAADLTELVRFHSVFANEFEAVLETWGWPGLSLLSWDEASAGAEVVRNCWSQPQFMRRILPVMEQGFRFGEVGAEWFAKHYDTLMFLENKPQVWGTFLKWTENDTLEPSIIIEPQNVDQRRHELLMAPLKRSIDIRIEEHGWYGIEKPEEPLMYYLTLADWAASVGWRRVEC